MRALVVYESMFGNTRCVAQAIADGLASRMSVEVMEIGAAPTAIDGVELVVAGGPTHAFGLSRPSTRADAARQAGEPVISTGNGLREWVDQVSGQTAVATFDTRVGKPRVPGSAARTAERRLRRRGFPIASKAASFFVQGTKGPLRSGEIERAHHWGEQLAAAATS